MCNCTIKRRKNKMKTKDQVKRFDFKKPPKSPNFFWHWLLEVVSRVGLSFRKFTLNKHNMEGLKAPYIMLSNHASMVDLMAAQVAVRPDKLNNVATIEAFHDYTEWLFRNLGVICKRKFTKDLQLIKNIRYSLFELGNVFCIYPEARYSLDGCTSYLPEALGKMLKMFKVPVVVMNLKGNFLAHPQWNKKGANNPVVADMTQIITQEEIETLSVQEINERVQKAFVYNDFAWQRENKIVIDRKDRAQGLHSLLYQCPNCKTEHEMYSEGAELWCNHCGKRWYMDEYGVLSAKEGETEFSHIPDWFKWERANVREEVRSGKYHIEDEVRIDTMPNARGFIKQGNGHFVHNCEGISLTGTAYGEPFTLFKTPLEQESIHIEYDYKYGGDVFDLATIDENYWIYPLTKRDILTKVSLATEELYFLNKEKIKNN